MKLYGQTYKSSRKNWGVISDAPLAFIIIGLVCGGIGYRVAKWHYQERISVLKEKLGGGSISDMTDRIDEMQRQIDEIPRPKPLSFKQGRI